MLRILYDQHIPHIETWFPKHFQLTHYFDYDDLIEKVQNQDILICRSVFPIHAGILKKSSIKLIATASSGTEHLQIADKNIVTIDAKGANAHAVVDYITCCLAYLDVSIKQSVAIIGHGFVGHALNRRCHQLGFSTRVYDPFQKLTCHWDQVLEANIILVHPCYHQSERFSSHHLLSTQFFQRLSPQTIVINASRGKVVDEQALLNSSWQGIFCSDVYQNEPHLNPYLLHRASLCTPHIAGHSLEAKFRITEILSHKIHQHFQIAVPQADQVERIFLPRTHWKQQALGIYSPHFETTSLKKSHQSQDFLLLRRAHHRQEFEFI